MIKLVAFDMDGVLTTCKSSWYFVHKYFETDNSENIRLFNERKIDYPTFMYLDVMLWKMKDPYLTREKLAQIYKRMEITEGAYETVEKLKSMGKKIVIITGGLDILAEIVSKKLGIDTYIANGLEVDRNGIITGRGIVRVDPYKKDVPLKNLMRELSLDNDEVASVGDGEVDIPMFHQSGISIAFNPLSSEVAKKAKYVVYSRDLRSILTYLP